MYYAIDRFEGPWALLEDDNRETHRVEREQLPSGAEESDVLRRVGETYVLDEEETARRREAVRLLQQRLKKKK